MSNLQLSAQTSPSVLTKILEPAVIRRFERVARVSRSCEIAASLHVIFRRRLHHSARFEACCAYGS